MLIDVYCFKKAMLTLHAIALRFGTSSPPAIPIPRTNNLPIFSDNVIPSLLIHLGIIDLSTSLPVLGLATLFPEARNEETRSALLGPAPDILRPTSGLQATPIPAEGSLVTADQAFILRAAAIDACELIVKTARELREDELSSSDGKSLTWLREITLPEIDAWLWSIAKDRADYRSLPRFAQRGTMFF